MKRILAFGVALAVAAGFVAAAAPAQAAPVTITNGTQFTDTGGNVVHAHGGGVLKVGAYYYWFGENRNANNTFRAVSVYRSTDLRHLGVPQQRADPVVGRRAAASPTSSGRRSSTTPAPAGT